MSADISESKSGPSESPESQDTPETDELFEADMAWKEQLAASYHKGMVTGMLRCRVLSIKTELEALEEQAAAILKRKEALLEALKDVESELKALAKY